MSERALLNGSEMMSQNHHVTPTLPLPIFETRHVLLYESMIIFPGWEQIKA